MTPEQEQLIHEIAAGLTSENYDADFNEWQGGYCCPLCDGEVIFDDPLNRKGQFKHAPNCLRTLVKRLLETLHEENPTRTHLTYQEASEVLGVSLETIKKAVVRGVLTRLPREGLYQHLMVGQVELFKGKTLSLSVLSEYDRKLWQAYAECIGFEKS